jgi:UDP-2,3-diacylglucosamine pyrophosphatase LpxH
MGRLADGRTWHPLEDFRAEADAAFDKLLARMVKEKADELIINGDWIDFLQLEPFAYQDSLYSKNGQRLGWAEEESLEKLESCKAAHAHKEFFDKLGDFLKTGAKLTVMLGNHDPDLFWPKVQEELHVVLQPPERTQVEFVRTFVRRGTAHVEHGNQHCSPENKFQDPENIFHQCVSDGKVRLEMVWGSIFVMEFFNWLERTHPYADKIKPTVSAVWLGIKNGWINGEAGGKFMKFLKGAGIPWRSLTELLSEQRRSPKELIQSIKDKKLSNRLFQIYNADPEFRKAFDEEVARTSDEDWKSINTPDNDPSVGLDELTPALDESSPTLGLFRDDVEFRSVRRLLRQTGVEQVVFGHTHTEIDGGGAGALVKNYYNTGTWIRRLDLKKKENRELLKTVTAEDLKRDELFESNIVVARIEVENGSTTVSMEQVTP